MRVAAVDYGTARTGVAVSDLTGTVVRPLAVVERVDTAAGLERLVALLCEHEAKLVVVGLPVSLDGGEHAQAGRARAFAARLATTCPIDVELYDERFTTRLADRRGGRAPRDARAAAALLEDYLRSLGGRAS